MTKSITYQITNLQHLVDHDHSSAQSSQRRFFPVMKSWLEQTGGAFDALNAFKRVCTFLNMDFYRKQADGYLDAAAGLRLPSVTISTVQKLDAARFEKKTPAVISDVTHQLSDMGSTTCYACAFFQKHPQSIFKVASLFDLLGDVTDFTTHTMRLRDSMNLHARAKTAPHAVQQAIRNEKNDLFIHLIRTVTAVATSVLACYLIMTGTALIPAVAAVTIAIANSVFTILAHYHKNYWCNAQLSIS